VYTGDFSWTKKGPLQVVGHFERHDVRATAQGLSRLREKINSSEKESLQGLKPNVTYFVTRNTGRAFGLYELRIA
jgi:hypothetical protein